MITVNAVSLLLWSGPIGYTLQYVDYNTKKKYGYCYFRVHVISFTWSQSDCHVKKKFWAKSTKLSLPISNFLHVTAKKSNIRIQILIFTASEFLVLHKNFKLLWQKSLKHQTYTLKRLFLASNWAIFSYFVRLFFASVL